MLTNDHFNPRSPHGERRAGYLKKVDYKEISTHAPRTGSDQINPATMHGTQGISTHAPRTGSDVRVVGKIADPFYFNPRSPHGERLTRLMMARRHGPFQPTLPARGATQTHSWQTAVTINFNPRSPHGERRGDTCIFAGGMVISTHAPRTGSDDDGTVSTSFKPSFQPTLPARGATCFYLLNNA